MSASDGQHSPSVLTRAHMKDSLGAADQAVGDTTSLRELEGLNPFPDSASDFSWGGEFASFEPPTLAAPPTPTPIRPDSSGRDGDQANSKCADPVFIQEVIANYARLRTRWRKAAQHYPAIMSVAPKVNPIDRKQKVETEEEETEPYSATRERNRAGRRVHTREAAYFESIRSPAK